MGLQTLKHYVSNQLGRAKDFRRDRERQGQAQVRAKVAEVLDPILPARRPKDHRGLSE